MKKSFFLFVLFLGQLPAMTQQVTTTIHGFLGTDGSYPCSLAVSGNRIYGAAEYGVNSIASGSGYGGIFAVNTDGSGFTNLIKFSNYWGATNGANPTSIVLSGNTLYGTANGGQFGFGAIFSMTTNGTNFKLLHSFDNTNSASPSPNLLLAGGVLYGTAFNPNSGIVYRMNADGSGYTNLYIFSDEQVAAIGVYTNADGSGPAAGVILSGNTLYGTTMNGGFYGSGTLFRVNTDGSGFANLHNFTFTDQTTETNADGANLEAPLLLAGNQLYGTANAGGPNAVGTIFRLDTSGNNFTNLHNFNLDNYGAQPNGGLTLVGNVLYGTAEYGGASGSGTVFSINPDGSGYTNLYNFSANQYPNSDGANPVGELVLANNILYGTASAGYYQGNGNEGAVFSFPASGASGAPTLNIEMSGHATVVYWPVSATGYNLQTTSSLTPPSWTTISSGIITYGNFYYHTNAPGPMAFFRLSK